MPALKSTLLIVEDEPTTRTLLTQIFASLGYPVRTAEDGFAALEEIRRAAPDILLSDLNMPGMSGFELLSVVRRKQPHIYVIATSGAFSGEMVPNGIAADAYHEKATGLQRLFAIVQSAVRGQQVRDGSSASTPIWISPSQTDSPGAAQVLISCPECLRSFSLAIGAADFIIHEAACVYCDTMIHYATVQPMNPGLPHSFRASSGDAQPVRFDKLTA